MVYIDEEYFYLEDKDIKKLNEYQKNYYNKNKEIINEKRKKYKYSKMVKCECGGKYLHPFNKKRHMETKKHNEYVFLHNDLNFFN